MQGKPKYRHLAILSSLIQGGGGSNSERLQLKDMQGLDQTAEQPEAVHAFKISSKRNTGWKA
jgi:hypothetical protein